MAQLTEEVRCGKENSIHSRSKIAAGLPLILLQLLAFFQERMLLSSCPYQTAPNHLRLGFYWDQKILYAGRRPQRPTGGNFKDCYRMPYDGVLFKPTDFPKIEVGP